MKWLCPRTTFVPSGVSIVTAWNSMVALPTSSDSQSDPSPPSSPIVFHMTFENGLAFKQIPRPPMSKGGGGGSWPDAHALRRQVALHLRNRHLAVVEHG